MKRIVLVAALVALGAPASIANATVVDVRIEGKTGTLFEGPIETSGRNVQAVSERAAGTIRKCDGTNGGAGTSPGATPTAAAVDAMSIIGQGFEGRWNKDLEDYFIRGFGPDLESGSAYWGLFVDRTSSSVGGCQQVLNGSTGVLWVYDAFRGRPLLGLPGAPISVGKGASTSIRVSQQGGASTPITGAAIASDPPVNATPVDAQGDSQVTFGGDGWYRLKASGSGFVRSNRLLVCVGNCGPQPADTLTRTPPPPVFYAPGGSTLPGSTGLATTTTPTRTSRPTIGTSGYRRGRIAVGFRVLQQGVGLLRWQMSSRDLTTKASHFVTRARGTTATAALLALPPGHVHALRFTATDRMLRDTVSDFGKVLVPIDDRSARVRRTGSWRKAKAATAWRGTVLRGRRGARIRVKLAAGRPAIVVRGRGGSATLQIGSKRVRVPAGPRSARRVVYGPRRTRAGSVTVTVLRGSVDLDGVAAAP